MTEVDKFINDNLQIKQEFKANVFGLEITDQTFYHHICWILGELCDAGYFTDETVIKTFNFTTFVRDYKEAYYKEYFSDDFNLIDYEQAIQMSINRYNGFADLYLSPYDYEAPSANFAYINQQLAKGAYFKS